MKRYLQTAAIVLLVALAATLGSPLGAQAIARIYGTLSTGAPIRLLAETNGSLDVTVVGGSFSIPVVAPASGTCVTPSYTFAGDTNAGIGYLGADNIAGCAGGATIFDWNATRILSTVAYSGTSVTGSTFGSFGPTPATSGTLRIGNNQGLGGRNASNSADVGMINLTSVNTVDIGDATNSAGIRLNNSVSLASVLLVSRTAPTIASGGCTTPAVTWSNGTATFLITIGTSCTGVKTFTLTMPAATNRWAVDCDNATSDAAQQTNYAVARATSTTAVVVTSYDRVTGLQEDFTASDSYLCKASGG